MSAPSEHGISKTFRLSKRLSVEMTVGRGGHWVCEWSPHQPRSMTPKEWRRYCAARREMIQRLAESIGGAVAMVDLEGNVVVVRPATEEAQQ